MNNFLFEVAAGRARGHRPLTKFGRIISTTGAAYEDVWPIAGTRTYLTTASTIRIKAGGDVEDDEDAGTGAQAVVIHGLDGNYNEISDTILPLGTGASAATTNTYLRVCRCYVTTVGSGGTNDSAITIEAVTGGTTQNVIAAGEGQSQLCAFTVPAGYSAHIVGKASSVADTVGTGTTQHICQVRLQKRHVGEGWRTFWDENLDTDGTNASNEMTILSDSLPAGTDVRMQVYSHIASAQVTGRMYVVLVQS